MSILASPVQGPGTLMLLHGLSIGRNNNPLKDLWNPIAMDGHVDPDSAARRHLSSSITPVQRTQCCTTQTHASGQVTSNISCCLCLYFDATVKTTRRFESCVCHALNAPFSVFCTFCTLRYQVNNFTPCSSTCLGLCLMSMLGLPF